MSRNNLFPGLTISRHKMVDIRSKKKAEDDLKGWTNEEKTFPEWITSLQTGQTIILGFFKADPHGKYRHKKELWFGTRHIFADADHIKGVEFDDDGEDVNPNGIEPFTSETGLSEMFPELKTIARAVGQSVSSMADWRKPLHRRYRIAFEFDKTILTVEQYHHILSKLASQFQIIAPIDRSPAQPVFGNAREGFNRWNIMDNILSLDEYLSDFNPNADTPPKASPTPDKKSENGYGTHNATQRQYQNNLDRLISDANLTRHETSSDGTVRVDCPFNSNHDRDAFVKLDQEGFPTFKCHHNSCSSNGFNEMARKTGIEVPYDKSKKERKPKRENPLPELKDASQYFIHDDFNVLAMSRYIQDKYIVWAQDSGLYIYDGLTGIYHPGENAVDVAIRAELGELRKARHVEETLKDLNATCRRNIPDTSHLIAFQNGVLDLKTDDGSLCEFSEHSPKNYLTSLFPSHFSTNFTETEGSKDFDTWLLDILDNDTGLHQVVLEVIGSIFHQRSTDMQRGILMVGEGGTGKSMLIEQIERMVGRENISGRAWSDYGYDSFAFGDLYSKALALDSDIDVSRPLSGAIKPAVTGNTLVCNQKYQQPFNFNPFATWIGSINKFPRTRDSTWGFFRRWIAIPFNKTFPTNSVFESKKRKLWSDPDTISSIIHKAVGLYRTAYLNGTYTVPDAAAELSRAMYQAANSIISWLDQFTTPDPETSMTRAEAYQSYAEYCIASGFEPDNTRNFYATLRSQGYDPDRKKQLDGKNVRVVNGLHLS